jgi:hypothetical protein
MVASLAPNRIEKNRRIEYFSLTGGLKHKEIDAITSLRI